MLIYSATSSSDKVDQVSRKDQGRAMRITLRQIYLGSKPNICSANATGAWGEAAVSRGGSLIESRQPVLDRHVFVVDAWLGRVWSIGTYLAWRWAILHSPFSRRKM
jgi:hypothetical protein